MKVKKQQLEWDMEYQTGSKLGKDYNKAVYCHCLFNLHVEHIMWNIGLDESQAEIKISRKNINNLRYADDTTLTEENEELKRLLMKLKEESEKIGLKFNIQKTKIVASGPITLLHIDWETMETVREFIFWGGAPKPCRWWLQPWN